MPDITDYIELPESVCRAAEIGVPVYMDPDAYRYVSYENGHPFLTRGPAFEDFRDFLERISGQFGRDYGEDPEMEKSDTDRGDYVDSFSIRGSWSDQRFYWKVDLQKGRPALTIWK